MKKTILIFTTLLAGLLPQAASAQQWSLGYYFGNTAGMPLSSIEWAGLTHVIHVNTEQNDNGTLIYMCNTGPGCSESSMGTEGTALINAAHANGVKVLAYVGTGGHWATSTNGTYLATFVANIMQVVNAYGYDGVDIDWEGSDAYNFTQMGNLFSALRAQLGSRLLTSTMIVTFSSATGFAGLQANLDRINMMSFDNMTNNPTWFNEALDRESSLFSNFNCCAALKEHVEQVAIPHGITASKINASLPFYGYLQSGATGPRQTTGSSSSARDYRVIVSTYPSFISNPTRDGSAQVPWFSPDGMHWVTYDDATSITAKVNYAKTKSLGGWFLWTIQDDWISSQTPSHPLLHAVALARGGVTPIPPAPPTGLTATVQ